MYIHGSVYAPGGPEWGYCSMKVIRRLARHGNSTHVCIPPQFTDFLRWRAGDGLVVEVTGRGTLEVRIPDERDLRAPMQAMTLNATVPELTK